MTMIPRVLSAAALLVPILSGCTGLPSAQRGGELRSEAACFASTNPNRCKLSHDLAGGYPFDLSGSDR